MPLSNWRALALGGAAAVLAVLSGVLVLKVRRSGVEVDQRAVAQAAASYHQRSAALGHEPALGLAPGGDTPEVAGTGVAPRPPLAGRLPDPDERPDPFPLGATPAPHLEDAGPSKAAIDPQVQVTKLYDEGDYEQAQAKALAALADAPDNLKLVRVVVSTACILGDADKAKQYYGKLPPRDQRELAKRCARYGVQF